MALQAQKVNVSINHAPLKSLFGKDLSEIDNPNTVKLIKRTLHFNLQFEHVPEKNNEAADALSRIGLTTTYALEEKKNI